MKDTILGAILTFAVAIVLLTSPSAVAQATQKTFSVVTSPKMISDFDNPQASIDAFYNNYLSLMKQYPTQLIVFYVSGGDHINSYPYNALYLDQQQILNPTKTVIYSGDTPLAIYNNGIYNHGTAAPAKDPQTNLPIISPISSSGTTISNGTTQINATQIVDNKGVTWTLVNGNSYENGVADGGSSITQLLYYNGSIYADTTYGTWYSHATGSWQQIPSGTSPPPVSSASTSGAIIPGATQIVDNKGVVWTLVNGNSYENGVADGGSSITQLLYYNGSIYADTTYGTWYSHATGSWQTVSSGDPRQSLLVSVNGASGLQVTFTINPIPLTSFPVMEWDWKKEGGSTAIMQFLVTSPVYNESFWIGYYAGQIPPNANFSSWAQFNLGPLPTKWTHEHVNLLDDLAVFLTHDNLVNGNTCGNSDRIGDYAATGQWQVTAVALAPDDGTSAHFSNINAVNSTSVPWNRGTNNADFTSATNTAPCGNYVSFSGNLNYLNQTGRAYPQDITYTQIKNIVQTFKTEGAKFGLNVRILDGVDAGHEFAFKPWQYGKHPEMLFAKDVIGFYNPLAADSAAYASYPGGIPQGTLTSTFIASQIGQYVNDLGFDGIYSTNGYGLQPAQLPYAGVPNTTQQAQTLAFFQNIKQAMGNNKLHVWEDTYLSPSIDGTFLNMPTSVFNYIDYVQLSTFFQSGANGDPFAGGWLNPNSTCLQGGFQSNGINYGYNNDGVFGDGVLNAALGNNNHETLEALTRDDIQSEITLRQDTKDFPNLKLLWVFYFNDPWYIAGYGGNTKTAAFQQYVNSMDGIMVYASDYQGNNVTPALQQSSGLMGIFSQPQTALTALATKPTSNTLGWLESVSSSGVVGGWSLDTSTPGTPADPTQFHVCAYIDGLPGVGAESPVIGTSIYRADVNAAVGTTGNHGFSWQLPSNYMDGKLHHIYIYGVNSNGLVTSLGNSGMSFTVQ